MTLLLIMNCLSKYMYNIHNHLNVHVHCIYCVLYIFALDMGTQSTSENFQRQERLQEETRNHSR